MTYQKQTGLLKYKLEKIKGSINLVKWATLFVAVKAHVFLEPELRAIE